MRFSKNPRLNLRRRLQAWPLTLEAIYWDFSIWEPVPLAHNNRLGVTSGLARILMETPIDKLVNQTKSHLCLECGKCVASCPFELWPMTIVEEALLGFDVLRGKHIWLCFTCDVCTKACPSGVRLADFIEAVRLLAISQGITEYCLSCERCGRYYLPIPIEKHIEEILKQKGFPSQFPNLCPTCRKYVYAEKMTTPIRRIPSRIA